MQLCLLYDARCTAPGFLSLLSKQKHCCLTYTIKQGASVLKCTGAIEGQPKALLDEITPASKVGMHPFIDISKLSGEESMAALIAAAKRSNAAVNQSDITGLDASHSVRVFAENLRLLAC
jgi:hypothetical protein